MDLVRPGRLPDWTDLQTIGSVIRFRRIEMPGSNPRRLLEHLSCLGAACCLLATAALAAVPTAALAAVPGGDAVAQTRSLISAQMEPPLLPSLVLPPDATVGPPTFAPTMRMGDSAMLHGDVVQARTLYERAASIYPASSAAMLAVGKTYDPSLLALLSTSGSLADAAKARSWYERARVLGDPAATELLARLP